MRKFFCCLLASSFLFTGCASQPENINATYVSPVMYDHLNCNQIRQEMQRVSRHVHDITGQQEEEATGDAVALGVGLVLFWPALFFMIGDDKEEELARLKGEYDALEQAAITKECNVTAEIEAARKLEEERKAKREAQKKEIGKTNE